MFVCPVQELREEFDIDVRVLGITGSSRMLMSDTAIGLADWQEQYSRCKHYGISQMALCRAHPVSNDAMLMLAAHSCSPGNILGACAYSRRRTSRQGRQKKVLASPCSACGCRCLLQYAVMTDLTCRPPSTRHATIAVCKWQHDK